MITDHTKFSPDWCFGLWKKKYRRTLVGGLSDLADVVNKSAVVNVAQLTGLDNGSVVVPTYDWQSYFSAVFTKLKGIKKLHHLRFESNSPGTGFIRDKADSPEVSICLLQSPDILPNFEQSPDRLVPTGLSSQRQWYFFNKIREFCPEGVKDTTCPQPLDEQHTRSRSPSPIPAETSRSTSDEPQRKRARLCGLCQQPGHNSRTCPQKL